jgi:hypothetical protein
MSKHLPPTILYVEIIWAMFSAGKVAVSPMALSADPIRATLRYEYFRMRGPTNRPESTDMLNTIQGSRKKSCSCALGHSYGIGCGEAAGSKWRQNWCKKLYLKLKKKLIFNRDG